MKSIPPNLPVGFVVVTHLFRDHKSHLSQIISRYTKMKVHRVKSLTRVEGGNIYVMPEDVLMEIKHGILSLKSRPPEERINNSIDISFDPLPKTRKKKR